MNYRLYIQVLCVLFITNFQCNSADPFFCKFSNQLRQKSRTTEELNSQIQKLNKQLEFERERAEKKCEPIEQAKLEIKLEFREQLNNWKNKLNKLNINFDKLDNILPKEVEEEVPPNKIDDVTKAIADLKFDISKYISKFKSVDEEMSSLRAQNKSNIEIIKQLNNQLTEQKNHSQLVEAQLKAKESQITEHIENIKTLQEQRKALQDQVNSGTSSIRDLRDLVETYMSYCHAKNCQSFNSSSSEHVITLQGSAGTSQPLKVLCNARIAGPGWTVVQRRFNGSVDFYRNWAEYQKGFGNVDSEFFMGLENLYQLTKQEPHELYIEMESFDKETRYARYDNFVIGSANEDYALKSLGTYSGTAGDSLRSNLHQKFSTYDHDRDADAENNCADILLGGWWYGKCGFT